MTKFTINNNSVETFLFPGGEIGVKIQNVPSGTPILLTAHLESSADVMALLMIKDAISRIVSDSTLVELFMPYTPYARQDQVMVSGESLSIKVFGNLINSMNFSRVYTLDVHSPVTVCCIDRISVIPQEEVFGEWLLANREFLASSIFVSPDAGANKKTVKLAAKVGHVSFVRADKRRDLSTGKILETLAYLPPELRDADLKSTTAIIADDICDGGRTFIELAKVLKSYGFKKVILMVTHGIFSQGFAPIYSAGIDRIVTTNSFTKNFDGDIPTSDKFTLININQIISAYN